MSTRVRFIARIVGDQPADDLGRDVVPMGDINGDGREDFMVWVPNKCEWRVYLGDTLISKVPYLTWPKGTPPYPCGGTYPGNFRFIPDISGDGQPDLLRIGRGGSDLVEVYFAGTAFDTIADLTIYEPEFEAPGLSHDAVAAGHDMNGDGQPDLALGDYAYYNSITREYGRLYVYWGGEGLDSIPDLIITDIPASGAGQRRLQPVGRPLAFVPSLRGGPFADLLHGRASENLVEKDPPGRTFVYFGGLNVDSTADLMFESPDSSWNSEYGYLIANGFGWYAESIGDCNLDGFADILVSGSQIVPSYVYFGGPTFDTIVDLRLSQPWPNPEGENDGVSALGDVNGDGHPDFCTYTRGDGLIFDGWVQIHFASATINGVVDWTISGGDWHLSWGQFARRVTSAGDIDGDGYDDVIVSTETNYSDPDNLGAVYIFAGYNPDPNTGVFDEPSDPVTLSYTLIASAYPNPFNSATTIGLADQGWDGTVAIFDILGREVRSFEVTSGVLSVPWDRRNRHGQSVASGLYFAKAQSGTASEVHKLVLVK